MFAKSIDEIKQDLIDHLATIDKTKLNIMDLNCYAAIVKTVDDMMKPDPSEYLSETLKAISNGYNYCACDTTDSVKVGVIDG